MDKIHAEQPFLKLRLFQGYGVELEYMIVDRDTLNVLPISDEVIYAVQGAYVSEINRGDVTWSNELVLHVIELKVSEPAKALHGLNQNFQNHVEQLNLILQRFNAMLMPTGMHPWMNPDLELRLWPHESNPIYEAFHRIFDCRGHGWANLQSAHLNLPFSDDKEFELLHAAIRVLLPIIPAIAASSPFAEGAMTGFLDNRLQAYMLNSRKIPSITGKVIPETTFTQLDYEERILKTMYRDIAPFDPDKVLQEEWLNSRGAIPRFERFTIEIRLLDIQEAPVADLAIIQLIVAVLKALVSERWVSLKKLQESNLEVLYSILLDCIKNAESASIAHSEFLSLFGLSASGPLIVKDLWQILYEKVLKPNLDFEDPTRKAIEKILSQGSLATRIQNVWQLNPSAGHLKEIYAQLCYCLDKGILFDAK